MTFDELVAKVRPLEQDRNAVGRFVADVLAPLGIQVDEASGELVQRDPVKPLKLPESQNERWVGSGRRRR